MKKTLIGLFAALAMVAATAHADDLSLDMGSATIAFKNGPTVSDSAPVAITAAYDHSYTRNFGAEIGATYFTSNDYSTNGASIPYACTRSGKPAVCQNGPALRVRGSSFMGAAVGVLPVTNSFELYAKAGVAYMSLSSSIGGGIPAQLPPANISGAGLVYGVGAKVHDEHGVLMKVGVTRYTISQASATSFNVGVGYTF